MRPFEKIAVDFAAALVEQRYDDARRLLGAALQKQFTAAKLERKLRDLYSGYAEGPAQRVQFDPQFSMEDWPAKEAGDVGWAYVGIEGDDFVEAVTVVVANIAGALVIREIEWGRP